MKLPQRKFREIVFQVLYSWDFLSSEEEEILSLLMEILKVTRNSVKLAFSRAREIRKEQKTLDERIQGVSLSYSFHRISKVELNILRLGVYELFYEENLPFKVVFAEAIRLCRKFGTPESANFVNAILDTIRLHSINNKGSHAEQCKETQEAIL